jgi:hypothetical protein
VLDVVLAAGRGALVAHNFFETSAVRRPLRRVPSAALCSVAVAVP